MPGIALPESFPIFHSSVLLSFTSALGKEKGEEKEGGEGVEEKEEKKEGGEGKEKKGEEKEGIRGEEGGRRRDGGEGMGGEGMEGKSIYYTQETSFKGQSISFLL